MVRRAGGRTASAVRRVPASRLLDVGIVVVTLTLFTVSWPTMHLTHDVPYPVQPFVAALVAFPFFLIRLNPALGWAISAAGALVFPVAFDLNSDYSYPWQVVHILVLTALLAAVAMRAAVPIVGVAWVTTALLFLAMAPGQDGRGWAVGITTLVAFGLLVRWLVSSRRQLAKQEEVSELERARRSILEERARIARDLHDVVAHHMSMVVVQAQSAPYRLGGVSDDVKAEFDSIGASGRAALDEIRGMLGVLRSDGQSGEHMPQPGARDVDGLLDATRRTGADLRVTTTGDPAAVGETVGLVMYRILQESLANAVRHAPGSPIEVSVDFAAPQSMSISNESVPAAQTVGALSSGTGGHGIPGMRERARAVGARLETGPRSDGGFDVRVAF
ncbi:histidine kinase [Rhodococcus sp. HNM0569]|uniref:sensor histidine kinase n=1 Tax=Rhodococcus sp. HNM0569 TaxID=2716340 RepID=UPI00146A2683|nr:histidine kinase [Rhodococcus sp. HNM0569]NLU81599.1 sensor histidine kinase [Rhodococcus sp. HNM0569]